MEAALLVIIDAPTVLVTRLVLFWRLLTRRLQAAREKKADHPKSHDWNHVLPNRAYAMFFGSPC